MVGVCGSLVLEFPSTVRSASVTRPAVIDIGAEAGFIMTLFISSLARALVMAED